jgi:hypothetical protein
MLMARQKPKTLTITQSTLSDMVVAKAAQLFATDANSWVGLYRLYELIAKNAGGPDALRDLG